MRVAVTYDNEYIFEHFGRTEYFKIYDIVNNKIERSMVISTNGKGHSELALFLKANNVDSLICGGIGGGAISMFNELNINVYAGVSGKADDAVNSLLNGTLAYSKDANCSHHDESHECGEHECHCK